MVTTKVWFSDRKSRSVNNFSQQPDLDLRWHFTPQVSRPDETNPPNPPGADFSISPSGFNCDMQSRWGCGSAGCESHGCGREIACAPTRLDVIVGNLHPLLNDGCLKKTKS